MFSRDMTFLFYISDVFRQNGSTQLFLKRSDGDILRWPVQVTGVAPLEPQRRPDYGGMIITVLICFGAGSGSGLGVRGNNWT